MLQLSNVNLNILSLFFLFSLCVRVCVCCVCRTVHRFWLAAKKLSVSSTAFVCSTWLWTAKGVHGNFFRLRQFSRPRIKSPHRFQTAAPHSKLEHNTIGTSSRHIPNSRRNPNEPAVYSTHKAKFTHCEQHRRRQQQQQPLHQ